jgi:hypothetical protein
MQHARLSPSRNAAVAENVSAPVVERKNLFTRFVEALHLSRRRQAMRLAYQYRHLIAEEFLDLPADALAGESKRKSTQNANGDHAPVRADDPPRQGV